MKKILATALIVSVALSSSAAPLNIGVASAVRGAVNATAPGAAGRVVETGQAVYSHDKVKTGPEGKLQILLLDQTSFTVGANSEMELDEFVFDPANNTGKVSAKITKGSFRFVTGKVARKNPDSMRVDTPVGTIGIRGTMVAGTVNDAEGTFVLLGPGPENNADEKSGGIAVKNDKGSSEVDKDGWGVTVKAGEAPSKPFELGGAQLEGILNGVGSTPKADQKDDAAAGGDSTDSQSGQGTATGKQSESDALAAADEAQDEISQFASQQFGLPTTATWEDVIAIPGGAGKYAGSAPYYSCPGSVCDTSSPVGTTSFTMDIDFAAKTVGGGTSNIAMTNGGGSGSILSQSYANLTGDAVKNLNVSGSGNFSGSGFQTVLKLENAGGVTAGAATIDVRWSTSASGQPIFGGPVSGSLTH